MRGPRYRRSVLQMSGIRLVKISYLFQMTTSTDQLAMLYLASLKNMMCKWSHTCLTIPSEILQSHGGWWGKITTTQSSYQQRNNMAQYRRMCIHPLSISPYNVHSKALIKQSTSVRATTYKTRFNSFYFIKKNRYDIWNCQCSNAENSWLLELGLLDPEGESTYMLLCIKIYTAMQHNISIFKNRFCLPFV